MKRTLIITIEYPPMVGGIATHVRNIAAALPPESVTVLAPPHPDAAMWDAGEPYSIVRKNFFFPRPFWPRWLRLWWHASVIVKEKKIEILMIHHALPVGYIGVLLRKLRHIPFVLFFHGTDIAMGTRTRWKRYVCRMVASRADHLFFISAWLKGRFLQIFPSHERLCSVLYPWPEKVFFTEPTAERLERIRNQYALQGKKVILSAGRMVDGKGFPHLIGALPKIIERIPNVVLVIAGEGPKFAELAAESERKGLQNTVRFIGSVPHFELQLLYCVADVFVLLVHPDKDKAEALGQVFLEAAASKIPIVAGRSGGVEEAVLHERTGLLVDPYQEKQVVEAIAALLTDKDLAKKLSSAGYERLQDLFQPEMQMAELVFLLR